MLYAEKGKAGQKCIKYNIHCLYFIIRVTFALKLIGEVSYAPIRIGR